MIQASEPEGPHYAVRLLDGVAAETRLLRATQSEAAEDLLEELRRRTGATDGNASKAHSRAMAAAAVAVSGCVGVDVEYQAPGRDILAVARWLMDAPAGDVAAAYRVFTFREAYFKAVGDMPERTLLRAVAQVAAPRFRTPCGLSVLHEPAADNFVLTLVWSGGGRAVRHDLPKQAERRL